MLTQLLTQNSEEITNPIIPNLQSFSGAGFFSELVSKGIGLLFVIAAIVFIFMIVWGAIQWITSGGDKNAVQNARGRIIDAIIGLIILLSSYAIMRIIGTFFNIEVLKSFRIDIESLEIK